MTSLDQIGYNANMVADFSYDNGRTEGRRVSELRSIQHPGTTVYVNSMQPLANSPYAGQEVAEYEWNAEPGSPRRKYVYADYIDEPAMMVNVSGETETKYYYHQNNLYSVAALTDQAGAAVERYSYTAYGKPTFHNPSTGVPLSPQPQYGSPLGNPYLFTGRRRDSESYAGAYYYRARHYDPTLGRFLGRDPIGYLAGDANLYRYVRNNPVILVDPTGLVWETGECKCVWEKTDHKGCKSNEVEPSGQGKITKSQCKDYCRKWAGQRKLIKIIWDGEWYDCTPL